MQKLKRICVLFLSVLFILGCSFSSYADVYDLLNKIDFDASDIYGYEGSDSGISLMSSLGNVESTVDLDHVKLYLRLVDEESGMHDIVYPNVESDGSYMYMVPSGYVVESFGFVLRKGALPLSGTYRMEVDHFSIASLPIDDFIVTGFKNMPNVAEQFTNVTVTPFVEYFSGDFYSDFIIQLGSLDEMQFFANLTEHQPTGSVLAGELDIAFRVSSSAPDVVLSVNNYGSEEYEDSMFAGMSDISSSIDDMNDSINAVNNAIQSLQGAMEPHYDNMLTQLHHITEQLHAFWDQQYNLHHVPMMAKLDSILDAILNLDEVFSNALESVKNAIDNMSEAIQTRIDDLRDTITHGFVNDELDQAISDLEYNLNGLGEVESVFGEYSSTLPYSWPEFIPILDLSGFENAFRWFSDFVHVLFDNDVVLYAFSIKAFVFFASIVFGIYRFKG